ncbi:hypothetical protein LCGC14_2893520, partial [marine sediment metagenome]
MSNYGPPLEDGMNFTKEQVEVGLAAG